MIFRISLFLKKKSVRTIQRLKNWGCFLAEPYTVDKSDLSPLQSHYIYRAWKGQVNLKRQCSLINMNNISNSTKLIYISQKVVLEISEEMPKNNCSNFAEYCCRYNENYNDSSRLLWLMWVPKSFCLSYCHWLNRSLFFYNGRNPRGMILQSSGRKTSQDVTLPLGTIKDDAELLLLLPLICTFNVDCS